MIKLVKTGLVLFVGLLAVFYATQNVVNLNGMYGALSYVMSNAEHTAYPNSFGPAITSPILIWFAVALVLVGEYATGLLGLFAAWKLFAGRATPGDFAAAKRLAIVACGIGMLTWFGFFMTFGGAYFQMWQTTVGNGSHADAFRFAAMLGIIALFVQVIED